MAANDNEGWDGIDRGRESGKAPGLIKKFWNDEVPEPVKAQAGTISGSGESTSQGSGEPSNTVRPTARYYGFLDDQEEFKTSTGRWQIQTYDCIQEAIFWSVLNSNVGLYQVLENKHNSASQAERQNRKLLHDKLFESKYDKTKDAHQTIHFLEPLEGGSEEKKKAPWGWALIEVELDDSDEANDSDKADLPKGWKYDLTDALARSPEREQSAKTKFQLRAPLLTHVKVRDTKAKILDDDERFKAVVPFLEEIFSLHHIPDAEIWGDDPTPLDPVPPPIVLSEGFALDEDMGLWLDPKPHSTEQKLEIRPEDRAFIGKKLKIDLDSIRQLPPKTDPKAHIRRLGWFDIWTPTDPDQAETQLYLLNSTDGKCWGFRLKIEDDAVMISESFSEGFKPRGFSKDTTVSQGSANGQTINSTSPVKAADQKRDFTDSTRDVKRSDASTSNVSPKEQSTKPDNAAQTPVFETVKVRRPLQPIDPRKKTGTSSRGPSSFVQSKASSTVSQPKQMDSGADKENANPNLMSVRLNRF